MDCKEVCYHFDVCKRRLFPSMYGLTNPADCEKCKDKSTITERPCNVGDTVWCVYNAELVEYTVGAFVVYADVILAKLLPEFAPKHECRCVPIQEFEKAIFLERGKALEALCGK